MSKDSHHRIVAFTKDWDDVPTCTTHILREMGKSMPVLWVNSIGTRKPDLRHPSHLKRIIKRLLVGFKRAELKENKIRVLSPILIPKVQSKLTLWINRKLFAWQVGRELRDMGDGGIEYWCFVPNAVDLLPSDKTGVRVVYYCVDDWTKFHYLDTEWVANKERALLKRADIVFAVSRYLERKLKELSEVAVHYMPHGVEYNKFHKALDIDNTPQDMGSIPRPVIGFYGNIYQWVDLGLVMKLAGRRADWGFVMIGDLFVDVSQFADIDNVYFLGRKEHDELPSYCATFNVAIIPYDMSNLRMESVSPVKSRELLAAGVPIVASDIPELREFGCDVLIAETVEEWITAIDMQLARKDNDAISGKIIGDDWKKRVDRIRDIVEIIEV